MKMLILDEVLSLAATTLPAAGVSCLLIGGFAVNHYGYMRNLAAHAITATLHGHTLRLPALTDLLAMKIFALAQAPARRTDKDLPDIAYLCVLNNVDIEREIQPLCQRYATDALYQQIQAKIKGLQT